MGDRPCYIVTGGAGFIGSNLAAELVRREPAAHVVVMDSFRSGSYANIVEAFSRRTNSAFTGSVVAQSSANAEWPRLLDQYAPRAVFHLGAITDTTVMDETLMLRENLQGFSDMLRACSAQRVPLVYASSAATYGTPPQTAQRVPFPESAAGRPNNVYGFSKWLMECEHRRWTLEDAPAAATVVGLRYFNVFGPGESRKGKMASMVYQLARQMLSGARPRIFVDGSQARDQVSVDDVVDCTIAAAGLIRPVKSGVYNLGSGVATSFSEIVSSLREALEIPESRLPTDLFEMPPAIRAFYQDYTCADMAHARSGLGWAPSRAPRAAIVEYGRWLKVNP